MNNGPFGMNPEKDGTWPKADGSLTKAGSLYCTQVNAMLREISNHGQSILTNTASAHTEGHDAGDEDPNAWS